MLVPWRVSLLEVMLRLLKGYPDPWETLDSHGSLGIFHEVHPKLMVRETQRLFRGGHLNQKHRYQVIHAVTFSSHSWRSLIPLKRSLNHPKKVAKNHQV